ncbi:GM15638 [Drosophila sechellia]|uniref:GM15638 n=1 Tax=Drosophila sechellia TaxID=7238 RepID=B4I850_DROSE|nr:GM15638 [Drosophila sechellia]
MCNHAVITQLTEALAHANVARLGGFLHSSPETGAVENSLVDKVIHSLPCDDTGRSCSSAKEDSAEDSEWGWAGSGGRQAWHLHKQDIQDIRNKQEAVK